MTSSQIKSLIIILFLNFTFESPEVIVFSEQITNDIKAPIFTLFYMLVERISEKGLKPTAKGNLPRSLCREIALHYLGEEKYQEKIRFGQINKEEDFFDLHVVRLVASCLFQERQFVDSES